MWNVCPKVSLPFRRICLESCDRGCGLSSKSRRVSLTLHLTRKHHNAAHPHEVRARQGLRATSEAAMGR